MGVLLAALLLVASYDVQGFALTSGVHKKHVIPMIHTHKSHDASMVLTSSAESLIGIPAERSLNRVQSKFVKSLMVTYIVSMCVALPTTLFPVYLLHKARVIDRVRKEKLSLKVAQLSSRWLMRIFPFASKRVFVNDDDEQVKKPEPSIWVCNHVSMLDLFFVLALDKKMRGKNRRPIKILYWRQLESNPVTGLMCRMCGFIPVDMADNGNGNDNEYDPKSFKKMLKSTKAAIEEGFDIGILPEGQLNPTPEKGLRPIYSGAYTLAKMSRRPIKMMALYGLHRMWHPDENIGMTCTSRNMAARVFPNGRIFTDAEEFKSTFEAVAGYFGAHGKDMPEKELHMWLDGSMWQKELARRVTTKASSDNSIIEGDKMLQQGQE